jgi:hypothetical protein
MVIMTLLGWPGPTFTVAEPVPTWTCPAGKYASAAACHSPAARGTVTVGFPGGAIAVLTVEPLVRVRLNSSWSMVAPETAEREADRSAPGSVMVTMLSPFSPPSRAPFTGWEQASGIRQAARSRNAAAEKAFFAVFR